jgi:SH3-like domain-containing protein
MTDYTQFANEQDPVEETIDEVTEETVEEPEITHEEVRHVKVTVPQLNLRSDIDGEVIVVLKKNTELEVLDETEDWYMVTTSAGVEGFVKAEYVE